MKAGQIINKQNMRIWTFTHCLVMLIFLSFFLSFFSRQKSNIFISAKKIVIFIFLKPGKVEVVGLALYTSTSKAGIFYGHSTWNKYWFYQKNKR